MVGGVVGESAHIGTPDDLAGAIERDLGVDPATYLAEADAAADAVVVAQLDLGPLRRPVAAALSSGHPGGTPGAW